jgi:hypothetical protein
MEAPDYFQPVAGVRIWRVAPNLLSQYMGLLWGPGAREPWPTGKEHRARCGFDNVGTSTNHEPPGKWCGCGLYAFYTPQLAEEGGYWPIPKDYGQLYNRLVGGVLAGTGDIELHEWGFRAEKGRVAALFTTGAPDEELPLPREIIADAYGAELIAVEDYEDFCARRGFVTFAPEDL